MAYKVAEQLRGEDPSSDCLHSHWAKFGENVYRALHDLKPGEDLPEQVASLSGCELNKLIADEADCHNIPQGLAELDSLPIRFSETISGTTEEIEAAVDSFSLDKEPE